MDEKQSLTVKEIQIKTTEIPSYTCQMAKIKNTRASSCWRGYGAREITPLLLVGVQTYTATMEIDMVVPQKIGN